VSQRAQVDAIVVGSGITGGWAAKELCERGLRVVMLERGKPIEHGVDYRGEHRPPWELPFRGLGDRRRIAREYPVQSQQSNVEEENLDFWANDREEPYQCDPDAPFRWIRTSCLGGRSLVWGRQVYRWSDLDFEANARDGHGVDWPIRYRDLAPWYEHVERFIGVCGQAEQLPHLPDGVFLPPMQLNCVERHAKLRIESAFPGRRLTIGRAAILTRPHMGRAACHYCGPCWRGCSTGSYFSTQSSTLPAARATGRLEVRTHAIVSRVLYDPERRRASGVEVIDARTHERSVVRARLVFLCASTLATARILLHSRCEAFPDGLANSSGAVGRYLMDHVFGPAAYGVVPGFEEHEPQGNRPNGIYIARFRNLGAQRDAPFLRGYGYQGLAMRSGWMRGAHVPGFGRELKEELRRPGPWILTLGGFGECLPSAENRVTLDPIKRDAWGIPQIRVQFRWGPNERRMARDMADQATRMLEAVGATGITSLSDLTPGGSAIHEMGTARMGRDPKTSVLNGHNQCHDVPNLFVTDGSAMASSACQNPSLTYMALTARAAAFAVDELTRGL
jgi:choline dehydrogenase-like flavoprotein